MWTIEISYTGISPSLYFTMHVYGAIFREKRVDRVGETNMYKVHTVHGLIWTIPSFSHPLKMKANLFEILPFCKLIISNWSESLIQILKHQFPDLVVDQLTARALISSVRGTFLRPPYLNVLRRFCRQMEAAPLYVLPVSEAVVSKNLKRYGRKASVQSQ